MRMTSRECNSEATPELDFDWMGLHSTCGNIFSLVNLTGSHLTASEGGARVIIHVNNKEKLTNQRFMSIKYILHFESKSIIIAIISMYKFSQRFKSTL